MWSNISWSCKRYREQKHWILHQKEEKKTEEKIGDFLGNSIADKTTLTVSSNQKDLKSAVEIPND